MKRLSLFTGITTLIGFALLLGSGANAQQTPAQQNPGQLTSGQRLAGRAMMERNPAFIAFRAVNPTPEQVTQFRGLLEQYTAELQGLRKMESNARRERMEELNQTLATKIENLLTAEQKPVFQEEFRKAQLRYGGLAGQVAALNLTPEQKEKVKPLIADTQEKIAALRKDKSLDKKARRAQTEQLLTELKAGIRPLLTPEQQGKLDAMTFDAGNSRMRGDKKAQGANP